ncbi:MAG: hypothetical protein ACKOXX_00680 [Actinomycetota bacterium]
MGIIVRLARFVGRVLGMSVIGRVGKRYPIVALTLFVVRWWRKRQTRVDRQVITLRAGETITVSDKQN